MSDRGHEEPLVGGTANRGLVVRVGDTVRKPWRPSSPGTAALLAHLEAVGFDGAPRHLGADEQGREVLTYVPGTALTPPYPRWALTDEALASVGRLLRRLHDAVEGFDASPHPWPQPVPEPWRTGLVSHGDPNLDNVVFRDGRAVALIDFDLAGPGSRVWDVAGAARLWAPLRLDSDITDARRGRALHRLEVLLDAYGLGAADRARLVDAVLAHHDWSYDIVRTAARSGHAAFAEHLAAVGRRADRSRRWYEVSARLRRVLRAG